MQFFRVITIALIGIGAVTGQDSPMPPRLIVRGDDMGIALAVNQAIVKCQQDGIQTSIEVIVPAPWFPDAVKRLKELPDADVGVHLALTSEWDLVKWRPLTNAASLRTADGYFFPMVYRNPNYPGGSIAEQAWKLDEIEVELRAQIELARKHIPQLSHVSSHMGFTGLHDDVRRLVQSLAAEYQLDINLTEADVQNVSYLGPHKTSSEKIASTISMLESLKPGHTYLFVDHPGLDTPEMRGLHHKGYEDVAIDRQGVTDAWTDPRVRDTIRKYGVQLINYRHLRKQ